jgi:transposase
MPRTGHDGNFERLRCTTAKAVKKWLAENEDEIQIFYLPSYSPELNPDELLNVDLEQRATKIAPARIKLALTRTAIGALRSIQKQPERVESYFGHQDVCYTAV